METVSQRQVEAMKMRFLSEHNEFKAFGRLADQSLEPGAELQFKRFDIDFPLQSSGRQDAPHGWHWNRWIFTLSQISRPGTQSVLTFLCDWECQSYGRWSGDRTPWEFHIVLYNDDTPLVRLVVGRALINCGNTAGTFPPDGQPGKPGFPDTPISSEYFKLTNRVRLDGHGNQESCNRS